MPSSSDPLSASLLPSDPVPLRPLAAPADSMMRLPRPLTTFIGREREVAQVADLLRQNSVRLVTLVGPGGVGKTRLALAAAAQVAADFQDGVWFAALASLRDPALLATTIAHLLDVAEGGERSAEAAVVDVLRERRALLALDNFEQLVDAAPLLARLLAACHGLSMLVTSRVALRLSGEQTIVVPPLQLPLNDDASESAASSEAVRLFGDRARSARVDFAVTATNAGSVAAICRRLDGLPLAIELAAARVAHLPLPALLQRLERRLPLLTDGPRDQPARLRAMRDAIAWSYDLLTADEQALFRLLSVFVGGFTLEAANAVAAAAGDASADVFDGVASLTDKSLLGQEAGADGEPRFHMLETVREFGLEQLSAHGEAAGAQARRRDWCLDLIDRMCPTIHVPRTAPWLDRLESDHDNLRAALAWSVEREDGEPALRLSGSLRDFWYLRGHVREGHHWLRASLAVGAGAPAAQRARALLALGEFANELCDPDRGTVFLKESLALYRSLGDRLGSSHALYMLGCEAADHGIYDLAEQFMTEARSQAEAVGDRFCSNASLYQLGVIAQGQENFDLAMARYDAVQRRARVEGDHFNLANTLWFQGLVHCKRGHLAQAADALEEALATEQAFGSLVGALPFFANLAVLALAADRPDAAARLLATATSLLARQGMAFNLPERLDYDQALVEARRPLEDAAFRAAWDVGRVRTIEESAADIVEVFAAARSHPHAATPNLAAGTGLTARELEVLRLVAVGHSNREIAEALFIGVPTVKRHLTNILAKLELPSRTALTAFAHTHRLV